jgi:hypothetical protein
MTDRATPFAAFEAQMGPKVSGTKEMPPAHTL